MRFSVMIWPFSGVTVEPVVRLAQVAEKCGFETVYIGDSQMIWNDVWVALTCCALATERVKLGPGVTNTVTRHPAVTANAVTTLNMISGRRAVLGVGGRRLGGANGWLVTGSTDSGPRTRHVHARSFGQSRSGSVTGGRG